MEVLILLLLIGVLLVAGALAFFAWTVRQHTYDHSDRLALLPLEEEEDDSPDGGMGRAPGGDRHCTRVS